jgi:hypothetical protein|tara:strand:- start:271 stop:591 length:321 start_codon:yes stop_codon:yes gene_type:complete
LGLVEPLQQQVELIRVLMGLIQSLKLRLLWVVAVQAELIRMVQMGVLAAAVHETVSVVHQLKEPLVVLLLLIEHLHLQTPRLKAAVAVARVRQVQQGHLELLGAVV